jgi:alanine dehydrogenase
MSVIAGNIAAEKVLNLYQGPKQLARGKVVIVGAGVAGMSATRTLNGRCAEIILLETNGQLIERLRDQGPGFAVSDASHIEICENTQANLNHALHGSVGLIIASRSGVDQAAHVVNLGHIESLAPGAVVVDIAIDQGGSIENPRIAPTDDLVAKMQKHRAALAARGKVYFAEQNMPRILPHEASIAHGTAILPYLTGLLVLCAIYGGAGEVTRMLLMRQEHVFSGEALLPAEYQQDYMQMMMQDLRNGMILAAQDGTLRIVNAEIANMNRLVADLEQAWALPGSST